MRRFRISGIRVENRTDTSKIWSAIRSTGTLGVLLLLLIGDSSVLHIFQERIVTALYTGVLTYLLTYYHFSKGKEFIDIVIISFSKDREFPDIVIIIFEKIGNFLI
jgi:hypothetical protein